MTDSVNIVHWNCQGFNAHGPEYIWSLSKQKHILKISVKSVVLTTTVVSLKHINNKLKIMIITISQIILTIIVIVIMINLLYRKCKMQSQILTIVHLAKTG